MRTSVIVLALSLAGCSDPSVAEIDAGHDAGSAERSDAAAPDAGIPVCAEYAATICERFETCIPGLVERFGSRDRCEVTLRARCEHEGALPGVPDQTDARRACVEQARASCDGLTSSCPLVSGERGLGEPCRSDVQCGAGLRCFVGDWIEPACDRGICQVPLGEGESGCTDEANGQRCADGLVCDGRSVCVVPVLRGEGEACSGPSALGECASGLVCGESSTCERQRAEGEACDPGVLEQCGSFLAYECDRVTSTCARIEYAREGEACDDVAGPRCASGPCGKGVCTVDQLLPLGAPCAAESRCASPFTCVDGICAPEPC